MAQSRRPDPVAPSESSGADATTVPPRPGRGLPVAVLVVAAALVLEGVRSSGSPWTRWCMRRTGCSRPAPA